MLRDLTPNPPPGSDADAMSRDRAGMARSHAGGRPASSARFAPSVGSWLAATLLSPLLLGCATPTASQFAGVRPGMTPAEVESILGQPSSRRAVPQDQQAVAGYAERWQYGDSLSSLATNAFFTDGPDERVFVIFFGSDGRVLRTQVPSSGPHELVNKP